MVQSKLTTLHNPRRPSPPRPPSRNLWACLWGQRPQLSAPNSMRIYVPFLYVKTLAQLGASLHIMYPQIYNTHCTRGTLCAFLPFHKKHSSQIPITTAATCKYVGTTTKKCAPAVVRPSKYHKAFGVSPCSESHINVVVTWKRRSPGI